VAERLKEQETKLEEARRESDKRAEAIDPFAEISI
jgi:hypothetical protein